MQCNIWSRESCEFYLRFGSFSLCFNCYNTFSTAFAILIFPQDFQYKVYVSMKIYAFCNYSKTCIPFSSQDQVFTLHVFTWSCFSRCGSKNTRLVFLGTPTWSLISRKNTAVFVPLKTSEENMADGSDVCKELRKTQKYMSDFLSIVFFQFSSFINFNKYCYYLL